MPPKVSVIIPTFNRGKVLGRAIDSVLAQTYQNWELIIVDDGSTDNTTSVVGKYTDDRIYYLYQKNQGANSARMTGIQAARGKYISLLDSDDRLHEEYLERTIATFQEETELCAGIATSYLRVEANGNIDSIKIVPSKRITLKDLVDSNVIGSFSCTTLRSQLFTEVGPLDKKIKAAQDYEYYLQVLKYGYYIRGVDEILVDQIESDSRISHNLSRKTQSFNYLIKKHGDVISEARIAEQYYMLGFIFSDRGDYSLGAYYFQKALQHNPKKIRYYYHFIFASLGGPFWRFSKRIKSRISRQRFL